MSKKQLQSEQTKKKVADAARALFVQKGYKATSIEDIVNATGSSKGNIYYHFKSKEGLFLYLLDEWNREWELKWLHKAHQYKTTTEKLYGMAEHLVADDLNHPLTKAADEFFHGEEKTSEVESRITEMVARHIEFNRNLLQEGIDNGEFCQHNAETFAIVLEALIHGLSHISRKTNPARALSIYNDGIYIFLNGIAKK